MAQVEIGPWDNARKRTRKVTEMLTELGMLPEDPYYRPNFLHSPPVVAQKLGAALGQDLPPIPLSRSGATLVNEAMATAYGGGEPVEVNMQPDPNMNGGPAWTITNGAWDFETNPGAMTMAGGQGTATIDSQYELVPGDYFMYATIENPDGFSIQFTVGGKVILTTTGTGGTGNLGFTLAEEDILDDQITVANQDGGLGSYITTFAVVGMSPPVEVP